MLSLSHVQLNMQTKKSGVLSRTSRRSMLRYAYVMYADICICHMLPDGHIARLTHTHTTRAEEEEDMLMMTTMEEHQALALLRDTRSQKSTKTLSEA